MEPTTSATGEPAAHSRWTRSLALLPLAMVLGVIGLLAWHSLTDLDIWLHLRAGRDLLSGAGFTHLNTYSFTNPDFPWLNHEWLFQVLTAWTGPAAGEPTASVTGWNILRLTLIMGLAAVLMLGDGNLRSLRDGRSASQPLLTSLVTLVGVGLAWPRFNLRPELLSSILLVLVVRETERYYRAAPPTSAFLHRKTIWSLFAINLIWAQVHGFAALAPLVILIGLVTRPRRHSGTWRPLALWAPFFMGLLALCLTPNGWHGLLFPLRALGQMTGDKADLSRTISELVPFLQTRNSLGLTMLLFKASLVWVVLFTILGWGRISLLRLALVCGAVAATFATQRSIGLYGVTFILLHTGTCPNWPSPWWRSRWPWRAPSARLTSWTGAAAALLITLGCLWWGSAIVSNDFYLREGVGRRYGSGTTPAIYPRAAATALTAPAAEHTFANLGAAAYLLGTTEARLFVDGRTEAYPPARWNQYLRIRNAGPQVATLLVRADVSAVVLSLGNGAFNGMAAGLQEAPDWQPVAADAGGVLWLAGSPAPAHGQNTVLADAARHILATTESDATRRADLCLAAAGLKQLVGDRAGAEHSLRTGLTARPDHPALNHNLGNILLAAGRFTEAAGCFGRALAVNHRLAGSALNLGVCQMRLQQTEAAVASFRRSLAIDPDQADGWVNLAVGLRQLGQTHQAFEALQKAVALRPGDARLQRQLRSWRSDER